MIVHYIIVHVLLLLLCKTASVDRSYDDTVRSLSLLLLNIQFLPQATTQELSLAMTFTFLRGPQTFLQGLLWGENFSNFSFQNGTFWRTLYFWPMAGHPNVARPGVANPPLPHPLDGSAVNFGTMCIYTKFSNRKNQFSI